jgi:tetrapyrrole methylase family protein/MazG family protein
VGAGEKFENLIGIVAKLRSPDGCPWDREQTLESLRHYIIEEAYETVDAIDGGDDEEIACELGDLLLEVLLTSQIASEEGRFDVSDAIESIADKLIRRHPHVFGDVTVSGSDEVLVNWERIKDTEGSAPRRSVLERAPRAFPALLLANKVSKVASREGFDWPDADAVVDKIEEEAKEFREALDRGATAQAEDEIGDLLFAVVNLARFLHVDPENACRKATEKFARRYDRMKQTIEDGGGSIGQMDSAALDCEWERTKDLENSR